MPRARQGHQAASSGCLEKIETRVAIALTSNADALEKSEPFFTLWAKGFYVYRRRLSMIWGSGTRAILLVWMKGFLVLRVYYSVPNIWTRDFWYLEYTTLSQIYGLEHYVNWHNSSYGLEHYVNRHELLWLAKTLHRVLAWYVWKYIITDNLIQFTAVSDRHLIEGVNNFQLPRVK